MIVCVLKIYVLRFFLRFRRRRNSLSLYQTMCMLRLEKSHFNSLKSILQLFFSPKNLSLSLSLSLSHSLSSLSLTARIPFLDLLCFVALPFTHDHTHDLFLRVGAEREREREREIFEGKNLNNFSKYCKEDDDDETKIFLFDDETNEKHETSVLVFGGTET